MGERRLPWARRATVSRTKPPTLSDDHPAHGDHHGGDDSDGDGDEKECAAHTEEQPQ